MLKRVIISIAFALLWAHVTLAQSVIVDDQADLIGNVNQEQLAAVAKKYQVGVVFFSYSPNRQMSAKQAEGHCRAKLDEKYFSQPGIMIGFVAAHGQNDFLLTISNDAAKSVNSMLSGVLARANGAGKAAFDRGDYATALRQICTSLVPVGFVETSDNDGGHTAYDDQSGRQFEQPVVRSRPVTPINWQFILFCAVCLLCLGVIVWMWWVHFLRVRNLRRAEALQFEIDALVAQTAQTKPLESPHMVRYPGLDYAIGWLMGEYHAAAYRINDAGGLLDQLKKVSVRAGNVRNAPKQEAAVDIRREFDELKARIQKEYDDLAAHVAHAIELPELVADLRKRLHTAVDSIETCERVLGELKRDCYKGTIVAANQKRTVYELKYTTTAIADDPNSYLDWHTDLELMVKEADAYASQLNMVPTSYDKITDYVATKMSHREQVYAWRREASEELMKLENWRLSMKEGVLEEWSPLFAKDQFLSYFDTEVAKLILTSESDIVAVYAVLEALQKNIKHFYNELIEIRDAKIALNAAIAEYDKLEPIVAVQVLNAQIAVQNVYVDVWTRQDATEAASYLAQAQAQLAVGNINEALRLLKLASGEADDAISGAASDIYAAEQERLNNLRNLNQTVSGTTLTDFGGNGGGGSSISDGSTTTISD